MKRFQLVGAILLLAGPVAAAEETGESAWMPDPAMISFHARDAVVATDATGQYLTLRNPSRLATVTARVHLQNQRFFGVFPLSELPEAWNSCNAMKLENNWFHADGHNSVLTFDNGPSEHGHLSTAPLLTQQKPVEATNGGDEGALYLMLTEASLNEGTLKFKVGGKVADGEYTNLEISTECAVCQGCF
ncbi:MAG: hypothetical protein ACO3LH_12005 [Steroidobacteraceae bacterium]